MSDDNKDVNEFIIFKILTQEFCIEMSSTWEIRSWTKPTALPNSADYLVGVVNLRGNILPILDLGKRLGLSTGEPDEENVIIVVQLDDKQFGLLVDTVSDIASVDTKNIRQVPKMGDSIAEEFFKQVVVIDERIICEILLDNLLPDIKDIAA